MSTISLALDRIGRGLLGIWCVSGPLLLIFSDSRFEAPPLAPLALLVGFFVFPYALAIGKIRTQGLRFLKAVAIDSVLFVVFSEVVGGAIRGLVAGFGGPRLPGGILFPILFALLGSGCLRRLRGRKESAAKIYRIGGPE